jgi:transposase-like protein
MTCQNCCITSKHFGKDRKGYQRFRCPKCGRTVTESHNGIVRGTYAPIEKAESVILLLIRARR